MPPRPLLSLPGGLSGATSDWSRALSSFPCAFSTASSAQHGLALLTGPETRHQRVGDRHRPPSSLRHYSAMTARRRAWGGGGEGTSFFPGLEASGRFHPVGGWDTDPKWKMHEDAHPPRIGAHVTSTNHPNPHHFACLKVFSSRSLPEARSSLLSEELGAGGRAPGEGGGQQ